MSRIIYLISFLNKINKFSLIFMVASGVTLLVGGYFYFDATGILEDSEEKIIKRFLKVTGIILAISMLGTVLIPSKEEMYMMVLTKDYEAEDVYKMTKDEIKGSIDYVSDRMKELKNDVKAN